MAEDGEIDWNDRSAIIICAGRSRPKFCAICGRQAVALCDWKMREHKSGLCDLPVCAAHAKKVGLQKHLCPEHQLQCESWKKRHPSPQGELFAEAT